MVYGCEGQSQGGQASGIILVTEQGEVSKGEVCRSPLLCPPCRYLFLVLMPDAAPRNGICTPPVPVPVAWVAREACPVLCQGRGRGAGGTER
jgi:hypothetical protein